MKHQHWRLLAESVSDIVLATDSEGTLVYANGASVLLGWPVEELPGRPISTLIPDQLHHIEGRPFHQAMLSKASAPKGCMTNIVHGNGIEVEVQIVAAESLEAERDETLLFYIIRALHTSSEYTSYPVAARTDALHQEQLYKLVFETAPIGLIHFDERGFITAVNEAFSAIVDASPRTLIGLNMQTLPHPQIVECVKAAVNGRASMYEGEYRSVLSGKITQARVKFSPTVDAEGHVTGGVGIVEDTTEQQRTQRALARAERMVSLGTLAAGVTHEINNPLSFTMAGIELARRLIGRFRQTTEPVTLLQVEATLKDAHEGAERVRTIVRDLKTFARSADERWAPVDIEEVLDIATKLTRVEIRHKARVERDFAKVPLVLGSEPRLVQLFVNLIANAAQAIDEGRVEDNLIRLVTDVVDNDRVLIEIHDTGVGIAKEDSDRIFEPFWTYNTVGGGLGLGLSICHGIVMAHGGEITVESEPEQGSVFKVTLPRANTDEFTDRSERITLITAPRTTSKLSILVVDDEEALGRTIQLGLENRHRLTVVTSGKEALSLLTSGETFDVVLCDLMLPDLPAPDLYEEVIKIIPEFGTRFVFMTGGAFTDKARDFLQRVPNRRLEKPFLLSELETVLDEWQHLTSGEL